MKKFTFLILAGLIIGIYYLWEVDKLPYPLQSNETMFMQTIDLQVPITQSKNRSEADSASVPHKAWHNNGFSCAGCHQINQNEKLNTYTCVSCHDGTLGFYNVSKEKGESPFHIKPVFEWQQQEDVETAEVVQRALTCSNCHNPHGSYSDRLLNNNPFGTARVTPENGGYLAEGSVYNYSDLVKTHNAFKGSFIGGSSSGVWFSRKDGLVEDTKVPIFMLVRGTAQQLDLVDDGVPANATVIMVYQYLERPATHQIPYRRGYYMPAQLPWLYGYDYGASQNNYWTQFFVGDVTNGNLVTETAKNGVVHYRDVVDALDEEWNDQLTFNYLKGYVYATDSTLDHVTSGEVAQSHSVILERVETANYAGLSIVKTNLEGLNQFKFDEKTIRPAYGARLGHLAVDISKYCSTCHLPYLAGKTDGKFSFAHQNFSDYDNWNCLKCHYGHEAVKEK
jgi:hypothetical protein